MFDVFLGTPMFEARGDVLGLPIGVLVTALGAVVGIIGLLWIRRITHVEPEQRIFRATTRAEPTQVAMRIGVVAFAAIALVVVVAGR